MRASNAKRSPFRSAVITRPLAVPSDGSPHKTAIASIELAAKLDHLAVPALAAEAYLRAMMIEGGCEVRDFNLDEVLATPVRVDQIHQLLFAIDSFDQIYAAMREAESLKNGPTVCDVVGCRLTLRLHGRSFAPAQYNVKFEAQRLGWNCGFPVEQRD